MTFSIYNMGTNSHCKVYRASSFGKVLKDLCFNLQFYKFPLNQIEREWPLIAENIIECYSALVIYLSCLLKNSVSWKVGSPDYLSLSWKKAMTGEEDPIYIWFKYSGNKHLFQKRRYFAFSGVTVWNHIIRAMTHCRNGESPIFLPLT